MVLCIAVTSVNMNSSCRLRPFVGRLFCSVSLHQTTAVSYNVYSWNIPQRPTDFKVAKSYFICRNFTIANENRADLEQAGEVFEGEIPTFKAFLSQLPSNEKYIQALMKALDCQKKDLKIIQQENLFWRNLPLDVLLERIKVFEELGVQKDDLLKHSSLLFFNFENSYRLLNLACELLEYDGHMLLPLVLLPSNKIESYLDAVPSESEVLGEYKNRIKYFGDKLQVPVRMFTEELKVHSYLLKLPLNRIMEMMDVLLEANVNTTDIFTDLWIFKYNLTKAKLRLEICKQAGLENIKPWIARCHEDIFWRNVEYNRTKLVMGNGLSWEEFVAELMNCSVEEVEATAKYDPRVRKVSFRKTKATIDYLLSEGFTPKEILQSPHVFCSSIRMLKKRLNMMRDAGLEPNRHSEVLRRMCLSNKAFLETFKKYFINYDYNGPHGGA